MTQGEHVQEVVHIYQLPYINISSKYVIHIVNAMPMEEYVIINAMPRVEYIIINDFNLNSKHSDTNQTSTLILHLYVGVYMLYTIIWCPWSKIRNSHF